MKPLDFLEPVLHLLHHNLDVLPAMEAGELLALARHLRTRQQMRSFRLHI
jgi:hypothetical protein